MATAKFAIYRESLSGQPWLDIDDAYLVLDYRYGCDLFTMSLRARRTEEEVRARLVELGFDPDKPRRLLVKDRVIGH